MLSLSACESEDTDPPTIKEETLKVLRYNETTEEFDIDAIQQNVLAPGQIRFEVDVEDNFLLYEYLLTMLPTFGEPEIIQNVFPIYVEDTIPVSGNSTRIGRVIEIPHFAMSGDYTLDMALYDEVGLGAYLQETLTLTIVNTLPVISLSSITTDSIGARIGDPVEISGEINALAAIDTISIYIQNSDTTFQLYGGNLNAQSEVFSNAFDFTPDFAGYGNPPGLYDLIIMATDVESREGSLSLKFKLVP